MENLSTVLVVDDEFGPRESLRTILKPDYRVIVAQEGEEAIRCIEQGQVDVVLLDLRMPGLSGIRVLDKIKSIDPFIEVILITGYASYDTVLEALRLHAFDYIPKPFNVPHVRDRVKHAAVQRRAQLWLQQCAKALNEGQSQLERLGQKETERSAELMVTIKELTTLCSAVGQNLRAPLQAMSDLSKSLLERHGDQLDAAIKQALQDMQTTLQPMEQLLDDLLAFSKVTRG